MSRRTLALSGVLHQRIFAHLLPGDGCEAAAILLCAFGHGPRANLIVRDVVIVPYGECARRAPDNVVWPGARLAEAQDRAEAEGLTLVLIHSHPGGLFGFSTSDDESDSIVMPHLFDGWIGPPPEVIGSAVVIAGGAIRARCHAPSGDREDMTVRVAGDDILHYYPEGGVLAMAFADGMSSDLAARTACIVGVSGTGSITAEQVARLGFGRIVLIDFDVVEPKNLNRIINSTKADADGNRPKVEVFAEAIGRYRDDAEVIGVRDTIISREAVVAASRADIIFCCVDSSEGRQVADLVSQAHLIPLVDMGVTIPTRSTGDGPAIADVLGRIDYVQPGRSSLRTRGVYTPESLRAEYMARVAPDAHAAEVAAGYIKGTHAEAPGVIALNMRAASAAVLEYLSRAFPFRHEGNDRYARTVFSVAEMGDEHSAEDEFEGEGGYLLGIGAIEPLLGLPVLAVPR